MPNKKSVPIIMGILNITPDSFSDGGDFLLPEKAVKRAKEMQKNGASIIDIGGESTAPHNKKISADQEWKRLEPIIPLLLKNKIPLSLDSYKSETWGKVLELESEIILNDVSGLQTETEEKIKLLKTHNKSKVIIMFSRDITLPDPENIMQEIEKFFEEQLELLQKEGIEKNRIILDTGMGGFLSKTPSVSFTVLKNIAQLKKFGCSILVGTSRKSFLHTVSHPTDPSKRTIASVISSLIALENGADIVRVHDVYEMNEAIETQKQCTT